MSDGLKAYVSARVFDGEDIRDGCAVLVREGAFEAVVPHAQVPADAEREELDDALLAPGFVDLQVNGGGGVMFNDDPSVATLER